MSKNKTLLFFVSSRTLCGIQRCGCTPRVSSPTWLLKTQRPSQKPAVLGLSFLGHCRIMAVQHNGLKPQGGAPRFETSYKPCDYNITWCADAPKKDFFPRHKTGCTQKRHWAAFIEINGAPSPPLHPDFNITSLDGLGRRGATCSVDIKVSFHGNKTKWFLVSDHWSLMKTSHFINLLCYTTQPQTKQILLSCVLQPGIHDITFVFFTLN